MKTIPLKNGWIFKAGFHDGWGDNTPNSRRNTEHLEFSDRKENLKIYYGVER